MMNALLIFFALLALADVWTTVRALKRPGTVEANPIIRWLMQHGKIWIAVKLAISGGIIFFMWDRSDAPSFWFMFGVCAVHLFVVGRNYRIGRGK